MSQACNRTHLWLYNTARSWTQTSCRHVSTTSAINRGLRATKEADGGFSRRSRGWQSFDSGDTGMMKTGQRNRGGRERAARGPVKQETDNIIRRASTIPGERRGGRDGSIKSPASYSGGPITTTHVAGSGPAMSPREAAAYFHQHNDIPEFRIPRADPESRVLPPTRRRSESGAERSSSSEVEKRSLTAMQAAEQQAQEIVPMMSSIKQHLSQIQGEEASTASHRPSGRRTSAAALRQALRSVNHMFATDTWTANSIHRGLRTVLPADMWSWREPDGSSTQLWFNRHKRALQLVWKGGVADSEDASKDTQPRPQATTAGKAIGASHDAVRDVSKPRAKQRYSRELRTSDQDRRAPKEPALRSSESSRPSGKAVFEESEDQMPFSVPYTTAASVFLYGFNTVLAALKAKRRRLYQLYLNDRLAHREGSNPKTSIEALAKAAGTPIRSDANVRLLDKMSEGRPHNGVVLEASKLPTPPVLGLGRPDLRSSIIPLTPERQHAEDIAVNGAPEAIPSATDTWRQPFIVMLDGITDPGNVGSVLRTCHFYGVDAVAIATNTCANLNSSILAKASSGACEAVRILALPKPSNFIYESAKAGWRVYASVAPEAPSHSALNRSANTAGKYLTTSSLASSAPLTKHPCILMLGAEGEGLRSNLKNKADYFVSIESAPRQSDFLDVGVDSVNVSVAASVLLENFLRKPVGAKDLELESDLGF